MTAPAVPWVTLAAGGVLAIAFAVQLLFRSPFEELELVFLGANAAALVREGEWYRLVTGNLLHAGFRHLAINVVSLLILGSYLEEILGRSRYLLLVLASALAGALASAAFTEAGLSVGASTAVFGLAGATLALCATRWSELPGGIWLPLALAAFMLLGEIGGFARGVVDTSAHAGGLLAGVFVVAALAYGRPLADLPAERSRAVVIASAAIALVFGAGLLRGVQAVTAGDRDPVYRWAEARLRTPGLSAIEINNRAYLLVFDADVPRASLEFARSRIDTALQAVRGREIEPSVLAAMYDTAATIDYRLGDFAGAVEDARAAVALDETPGSGAGYAAKLVRFEAAQLERDGLLRQGAGEIDADLRLEPALPDEEGRKVLVLELTRPPEYGAVVHVLIRRDQRLVGYIDARLGPGRMRQRFAQAGSAHNDFGDEVSLQVALLDTRPGRAGIDGAALRIFEISVGDQIPVLLAPLPSPTAAPAAAAPA